MASQYFTFSALQNADDWSSDCQYSPMPQGMHEDNIIGMREIDGVFYIASTVGVYTFEPDLNVWEKINV